MTLVKIDGSKIGLGELEVKATFKTVRRSLVAQKHFAEANAKLKHTDTDDDILALLNSQVELLDEEVAYLKDVLKLTKTQVEKVEDSDPNTVTDFIIQLSQDLMGGQDESKSSSSETGDEK